MAKFTDYLALTLPELNEFANSWNEPLNQNFEDLDDWTKDLYDNLVGVGTGATWSALRGTLQNLSARLAVSIGADGTVNLSSSPEIADLSTSNYRGQFLNPTLRFESSDGELYNAGQPFTGTRHETGLPGSGFPRQAIDDSIAFRSRDFGADADEFLASPGKPYGPGLVVGGNTNLISVGGTGEFELDVTGDPAIFNIDGYLFRLRSGIKVDYSNLTPSTNDWVWVYVSRLEDDYTDSTFLYDEPAGSSFVDKDLRQLRSGSSNGSASTSTFVVTGESFNVAPYEVQPGDLLVITTGTAAGSYVISTVGGDELEIEGIFKDNLANVSWYVLDAAMPNIGAEVTSSDSWERPPFVEGRVYIGRFQHQGPGSSIITFTRGGVYDSGWSAVDASSGWPKTFPHNLGVIPSRVEMWVRDAQTDPNPNPAYRPLVRRQIQTDDTPTYATLLLPSMQPQVSETEITITLLNATTVPSVAVSLATDAGGGEISIGQLRVVCWR